MSLSLDISRLARELQIPFEQLAKLFPLGPQYLADESVGADQMADLSWTTVTYGTNWRRGNNSESLEVQSTVSAEGLVLLRGIIQRTTSTYTLPNTICTLPTGHRPGRDVFIWVPRTSTAIALTRINITTAGAVIVDTDLSAFVETNADFIYLDGVTFSTVA